MVRAAVLTTAIEKGAALEDLRKAAGHRDSRPVMRGSHPFW
jgi:hypothetical protein